MQPIHVDFYLINSDHDNAQGLVACSLIEKAYTMGHKIYVHCNSQHDAEALDELLWTYKDDSFIPHNLNGEGPEPPPPVQIGCGREPRGFNDLLINMATDIPAFYSKFKKILEIVPNQESEKALSRLRYKEYRARGLVLQMHNSALTPEPSSHP